MWRRAVLVQATLLLAGAWDLTYYTRTRLYPPIPRLECFEYPDRDWSSSWRQASISPGGRIHGERDSLLSNSGPYTSFGLRRALSRPYDSFPFSFSYVDIAKEHAKLVRDINGLKHEPYVQVAPHFAESEDYDDSIYQEEMETSTKARPVRPARETVTAPPYVLKRGALAAGYHTHLASAVRLCLPPAPLPYTKPSPNLLQRLLGGFLSKY